MSTHIRRSLSRAIACFFVLLAGISQQTQAAEFLPQQTTFVGTKVFRQICIKAEAQNWRQLPIGERIAKVAKELEGTPYRSFTLEIDDHIESPSVNLLGLDCWTFFEVSLGIARMLENQAAPYSPKDLLREIESTRYRNGRCRGQYLDRIHYLAEWFVDNHRRGNVNAITHRFPHQKMGNTCNEMSRLWKSYRYLKHNPELRIQMAQHEQAMTRMEVVMIPKQKVAGIEKQLKTGDIIGIARTDDGSYCSHVGLIIRDAKGDAHFMHASSDFKKVVVDQRISRYLARYKKHAGILVARPR